MTSRLERARRFLLGGCRSTALRVAPLALLALGALQAATVTVDGPDYRVGGGSITSTVVSSPNGPGIKFFGSASSEVNPLNSSLQLLEFDFIVHNDGGPTTRLDFAIDPFFQGNLGYQVTDGAAQTYASGAFIAIPDDELDMVPFIAIPASLINGGAVVANGTVRFSFSSSNPFSISIPGDSIDFTPTASAVPEPGTLAMGLAGVVVLALARRRR